MAGIELLLSTGDPFVDAILRGVVGVFETAFPGRVRGYYLAGSHAEGTATATSDVDLDVVFKSDGEPVPDEARRSGDLIAHCNALSPVHLDVARTWEHQFYAFGSAGDGWSARSAVERRVYLKLAKRPFYGEDIRERVLLPPFEFWPRALFAQALAFIARARGEPGRLIYPLVYPDPGGPVFGYDGRRLKSPDGALHDTTRDLVRAVLGGANAILAWKTRRYVTHKGQIARAYRETVGDAWADVVEAVDRTCRLELDYLVPPDAEARGRLRDMCAGALAFENHAVACCREFLREELERAGLNGGWLPAELAGWLLDRAPDTVQVLAAGGELAAQGKAGRAIVAAGPCVEVWATNLLGRILFPHEPDQAAPQGRPG
jgi:hypothetical protein